MKQKKLIKRSKDGSISYDDPTKIRKLLKLATKELRKIAQLRDIDTTNVTKTKFDRYVIKISSKY